MAIISLRLPDELVRRIKLMAKERGSSDSEMMRVLMLRGLDQEGSLNTKLLLESLCLARRIAAVHDIELIEKARNDAQVLLEQIAENTR